MQLEKQISAINLELNDAEIQIQMNKKILLTGSLIKSDFMNFDTKKYKIDSEPTWSAFYGA